MLRGISLKEVEGVSFCVQRWKEEIFGICTRVISVQSVFFPILVCAGVTVGAR